MCIIVLFSKAPIIGYHENILTDVGIDIKRKMVAAYDQFPQNIATITAFTPLVNRIRLARLARNATS